MDEEEFKKAEQASDQKEFENCLTKLMECANKHYDAVYLKYKNNPDIEKFSFCRQNFSRIKSIIESKENPTQLNTLYLEAWISLLYSDVHALNLEPETKDKLNKLIEKIQIIGIDFKQLVTKKSGLDSSNEDSARLLNYIDDFEYTWKTKEKRLLADSHYNFAETLVENSDSPKAINYFEKSLTFYKNAAEAADEPDKAKFFTFAEETNKRLEEIKAKNAQSKKSNFNDSGKKLNIGLQRLPDSISEWSVIDEAMLSHLTNEKKAVKIKPIIKKDTSIGAHPKIKSQLKLEYEQLLKIFTQMDDNLKGILNPFHKKSFNERRAIAYNNYAITKINNLIDEKKNAPNSEKLEILEKAQKQFERSSSLYTQANLLEEKAKAEGCIDILTSIKEKLNASPRKETKNSSSSTNIKRKISFSSEQDELPVKYYTRAFFKDLSRPENNVAQVDNQNSLDNKPNSP